MDKNNYKNKLEKEKTKLESLISEMQDNTLFGNTTAHTNEKYSSGELSSYDNHPGDIGTDVYMNDMQNSLTNHQKFHLEKINDAISKIENNTFGYCENCDRKIESERLEILPETNLCATCAKKLESSTDDYTHYDLNNINNNPNFYSEYTKDLIDKKNRR